MSTSRNTTQSDNKQPPQPLFEPFPEPQTYPKYWDGTALEELSRPKTGKPNHKPKPQV